MTEANATIESKKVITLAESQKQSVALYGDNRAITMEIKALRASVKSLKEVDDAGVAALVIASKWSNLNPYSGEIYYVPRIGVTISSKVKASDAITAAQKRGDTLTISYFKFDRNHPFFAMLGDADMADNDVAVLCEIISSKSHTAWLDMRIAKVREMKAIGYDRAEIEATLKAEYGAPPVFRAVGYVKGAEDFGDQFKKFVAFSRFDRAKKRALIKCLNANGLSAPDQRKYGIPLEDERDDDVSPFEIKTPLPILNDAVPAWIDATTDDATDAPPTPISPEQHARNQRNLRGDGNGDGFDLSEPERKTAPAPVAPEPTHHAANQEKLGRNGQDADFSKPDASPSKLLLAKARFVRHAKAVDELAKKAREAGDIARAEQMDAVIRKARRLPQSASIAELHAMADELKWVEQSEAVSEAASEPLPM